MLLIIVVVSLEDFEKNFFVIFSSTKGINDNDNAKRNGTANLARVINPTDTLNNFNYICINNNINKFSFE